MKCGKCNNEINNDDVFCPKCGTKVERKSSYTEHDNIKNYSYIQTYDCRLRENTGYSYHHHHNGYYQRVAPIMNVKVALNRENLLIDFNDGNVDSLPLSVINTNSQGMSSGIMYVFFAFFIIIALSMTIAFLQFFPFMSFVPIGMAVMGLVFILSFNKNKIKSVNIATRDKSWIVIFNSTKERKDFLELVEKYKKPY